MNKKRNTIVINGRRYDAGTGEFLSHDVSAARHPAGHHAAGNHTAAHKPAIHRVRAGEPAEHKPDDRRPASHRGGRHIAAHRPQAAQTLMRQTVKKPEGDLRRRIKVQGRLDISAKRSPSKIIVRSNARRPNIGRLQNSAAKRSKGRLISHFSPDLFAVEAHTPSAMYGTAPVKRAAVHVSAKSIPVSPARKDPTTDDLLEYAVQHASAPVQPPARKYHHRKLFKRHAHAK